MSRATTITKALDGRQAIVFQLMDCVLNMCMNKIFFPMKLCFAGLSRRQGTLCVACSNLRKNDSCKSASKRGPLIRVLMGPKNLYKKVIMCQPLVMHKR